MIISTAEFSSFMITMDVTYHLSGFYGKIGFMLAVTQYAALPIIFANTKGLVSGPNRLHRRLKKCSNISCHVGNLLIS